MQAFRILEHTSHACRLQDAENKLLVGMFHEYWAAQGGEAATSCPAAEDPQDATSDSPEKRPSETGAGAEGLSSMAMAKGTEHMTSVKLQSLGS